MRCRILYIYIPIFCLPEKQLNVHSAAYIANVFLDMKWEKMRITYGVYVHLGLQTKEIVERLFKRNRTADLLNAMGSVVYTK